MFRLVQVKQSSEAPVAGARRRLLRWGMAGASGDEAGGQATGSVMMGEARRLDGGGGYGWVYVYVYVFQEETRTERRVIRHSTLG